MLGKRIPLRSRGIGASQPTSLGQQDSIITVGTKGPVSSSPHHCPPQHGHSLSVDPAAPQPYWHPMGGGKELSSVPPSLPVSPQQGSPHLCTPTTPSPQAALLLSPISGPALSQCHHHILQPHRPHSSSCPADAHCHPLPHFHPHQPVLPSVPYPVPSSSPSLLHLLIISLHPHVPISSRSLCPSPLTRRWGGGLPAAGR